MEKYSVFNVQNKNYSCFNIGFLNVNSLRKKLHMLFDFVVGSDLDVLGVAESWLTPDVPESFVSMDGYGLVRCDSESGVSKHGVCLYIKRNIKFRFLDEGCGNVCCVHLVDFDLFIAVVYRPPSNSSDENNSICNFLYDFCDSRELLGLGDSIFHLFRGMMNIY